MLESLAQSAIDEIAFRIANPRQYSEAIAELGANLQDIVETVDFVGGFGQSEAINMLDSPFVKDPSFAPKPTRYSDGSWRVFYSAIEQETAQEEWAYWCKRRLLPNSCPQKFHYRELRCRVSGPGYDLRPRHPEWSFLTGDEYCYPQCQAVAKEAMGANAVAMLCPSARRGGGTTLPAFARAALSDPVILGSVTIEFDVTGEINITRSS